MQHLAKFFVLVFCLSLFTPAFAQENDDFNGEELSTLLEIREEDRYLTYGEYAEIEITAKEAVNLNINSDVVPFGMELEKVSDTSFLIYGRSEFLGKLCFLVEATKLNNEVSVERLCLYADENADLNYPQITTERDLEAIKTSEYASVDIEVATGEVAVDITTISGLPDGLVESINSNGETTTLSLVGAVNIAGVYEFVVKAIETETNIVSYKQFTLEVATEVIPEQCAPGYYYDDYLGYCVQTSGSTCGAGTFYDIETNSCVAYRTPRGASCGYGTYYDHWLNRCVVNNAYRCPINYEWDGFSNRCIRLPYSCSYGERYNYRRGICVPVFRSRMCSFGTYYDSFRGRCIPNRARFCARGNYWNGRNCIVSARHCGPGRYFDHYSRRCVGRAVNRFCGPRSVWNHRTRSCSIRTVHANRTCRAGTRWSGRNGRCIGHDNTRVNRHPRRNHRPGPVVRPRPNRPNRPTTRPNRPNRPTTRPDRPNRPNRPTTRPDRPNRPTTRPDRPNRPTTRPDRPNRPTTRPDRPNRPTTRPDRPNRPNRPTTRPDRPNRPNRPTTRPDRPNRPNRPTTRPDRPTRPTTRPDRPNRPNRPTTRPDRPNRPNRPTTRPDRPNRPNRPTTRPDRPTRPTTRPDRPTRPTTRPDRPNRPTTRPDRPTRPTTRPDRPTRPTTRPDRPNRPSGGSTTRPSRPSRPSSGSTTRPSRGNNGNGNRGNSGNPRRRRGNN